MKKLPYFKWHPADAEIDEFYASLSYEEKGVYHVCLNRSWMNGGIPADHDKLAAFLGITRRQLDRIWCKLGERWHPSESDPSRLVNPRQEQERSEAITKGENNKRPGNANASKSNANETRSRSNRVLRAYDSDSDSGSPDEVISFPKKKLHPEMSYEAVRDAWEWYKAEYPSEVNEFTDLRLFTSVMEAPEDLAELRKNLPLWKQTQKWIDGFSPASKNFLSQRVFKITPKARDSPRPFKTKQQEQADAWDRA